MNFFCFFFFSSKGDPEETKEYVIPLIKKNLWKKQIDDKFKKTVENKTEPLDSLETLAAQEIVEGVILILLLLETSSSCNLCRHW